MKWILVDACFDVFCLCLLAIIRRLRSVQLIRACSFGSIGVDRFYIAHRSCVSAGRVEWDSKPKDCFAFGSRSERRSDGLKASERAGASDCE